MNKIGFKINNMKNKSKPKKLKIDYTGAEIGWLTVIDQAEREYSGGKWKTRWNCKCKCGNEVIVRTGTLTEGKNNKKFLSCGCYKKHFNSIKNTLPNNLGPKREIMRGYIRRAKEKGLDFKLSEEQFIDLIDSNCEYCGSKPSSSRCKGKEIENFWYNGIDRVDTTLGYVKNNVVTCCSKCNMAKRVMPIEQWFNWVYKLYHNLESKGTFNDYPAREYIVSDDNGNGEDPTGS